MGSLVKVMLGNYPGISDRHYLQASVAAGVEVFCWPPYGAFFPPQGRAPDPRQATIRAGSELAGWSAGPDLYISWASECRPMPADLAESGVPVAINIGDWNLSGRLIHQLEVLDLPMILDSAGMLRLGERFENVFEAFPWGWDPRLWPIRNSSASRDIDVLFVGSRNNAIHREREQIVAQLALAAMNGDYHVETRTWLPTDQYQLLAERAKIIVNYSVRGEANMRNFEALASGCRLLNESSNQTLPRILIPGLEYATYEPDQVQSAIKSALQNWTEWDIAQSQARLPQLTFDALIAKFINKNLDLLMSVARPLRHRRLIEQQWLHTNDQACIDPTLYGRPEDRERARIVENMIVPKDRNISRVPAPEPCEHQGRDSSMADHLARAELALADGRIPAADHEARSAAECETLGEITTIPVPDFSWWRLDLERRLLSTSPDKHPALAREWMTARALFIRFLVTREKVFLARIAALHSLPEVPELMQAIARALDGEARVARLRQAHLIDPQSTYIAEELVAELQVTGESKSADDVLARNMVAHYGL